MKDLFPLDAAAIWHMKDASGNENCPFQLEELGAVRFEHSECDTKNIIDDGNVAILENASLYLHTYRARKYRPASNALTLFISAEWNADDHGTLFFSDFLGLSIYDHGLAAAFVGVETPTGKVYREIPLGFPKSGGKQIWILRISNGSLSFFANGKEYCSIPFPYTICAPFDSSMIFGGFQSLKPDTYDDSSVRGKFRRLSLDTVALWHRGLSEQEIAALSGVSLPLDSITEDSRVCACMVHNKLFDASVKKDPNGTDKAWRNLQKVASEDKTRPTYHLTQAFGHIFDPCGAFYYDNKYHVFSYRSLCNTLDYASLDHYVSDDLVHWTAYPIGPFADSEFDVFCIYLMNHFIDKDGRVRVLYTGQGYGGKCGILAESHDNLLSYTDKQAVLTKYHHDGHVFMHGDKYYTITSKLCRGTRSGELGDPVMMWSSDDLVHWQEESEIFCQRKDPHNPTGFMEFPYLLNFGERDVLILGGHPVKYWIGHFDWESLKFKPDHENGKLLDNSNSFHCFNPLCIDNKGEDGSERRLIMALYPHIAGISPIFWHGVHAQPRVLSLTQDHLHQDPCPELEILRESCVHHSGTTLAAGEKLSFCKDGDAIEISARFAPANSGKFGIELSLSENDEPIRIYFDAETRRFGVSGSLVSIGEGDAGLSKDEAILMRVFIDRQFIEVFVNGQTCTTCARAYTPNNSDKLDIFAEGKSCLCESLDIWKMSSAL